MSLIMPNKKYFLDSFGKRKLQFFKHLINISLTFTSKYCVYYEHITRDMYVKGFEAVFPMYDAMTEHENNT